MMPYSKRELNKAKTKYACLNAMLKLNETDTFRDIKAKEIAKSAGITEMTFFNYFKTKDDLLLFYMQVWSLDQAALQESNRLYGYNAIERIFISTANEINNYPNIMLSLIGYIATMNKKPIKPNLTAEEKYLRYPELTLLHNTEVMGLDEMLYTHLHEIDNITEYDHYHLLLLSAFYGNPFIAHITNKNIEDIYNLSLRTVFER